MPVVDADEAILLQGHCTVEEAEPLKEALVRRPDAPVDASACTHAHTAVVQVLMCASAAVIRPDTEPVRWQFACVRTPEETA